MKKGTNNWCVCRDGHLVGVLLVMDEYLVICSWWIQQF